MPYATPTHVSPATPPRTPHPHPHSQVTTNLALPRSFLNDKVAYACGGSGSLYKSEDGGASWKRDKSTDDVAGNLYAVKFFPNSLGFILGNNGILLRYIGSA